MSARIDPLPAHERRFLTDGGLETTLVFQHGIPLPEFAAFPLLGSEDGKAHLDRYFGPYLDLAESRGTGFVIDTVTWRANPDWGTRLGCDEFVLAEVNRRAVAYAAGLAAQRADLTTVLNGVVGPRGDGYVVVETMTAEEAAAYHSPQVRTFAESGAQMATAVTMTYAAEAIGIVAAATAAGLPVAVSFTVETDGHLPSGQGLGEAIDDVDRATDRAASYFMVNCAHPAHFEAALRDGGAWVARVQGIRANSSALSHAELDALDGLDRGDVAGLARHYGELDRLLPDLRLAGGCCGTDLEHIRAIVDVLTQGENPAG